MDRIQPIVALLVERPQWSSARIARKIECDPRRVRRYRRLLAETDVEPAAFLDCDVATLDLFFNGRRGAPPRRRVPSFAELEREHPGSSGRSLWRAYAAEAAKKGELPMSYSQFLRRWKAEHERQ